MKNTVLFLLFATATLTAFSQARQREVVLKDQPVNIYRTLEQVVNDQPESSVCADVAILPQEHGVTYHRLLVNRKEGRKIGRVYAFSIGNEAPIFINPSNPKLRKGKNFYGTERIGDFINFATVGEVWIPGDNGRPPYRFTYPREELLEVSSGKTKLLTRKQLKRIISDDRQLLAEFKVEEAKSIMLIPYLKEYYAMND